MTSWAERVHRRAADFGSVVTSCGGHPGTSTTAYPYRLEKVKFGVALEEVCKNNNNIPGPLLVLILKLNKESPNRRDVFRAPGHQGAMKKLIHFLQAGRLVNVDNYPVHTIASVLKKFLRKIPNGIFGVAGERELFAIIELEKETEQTERLYRLITSLPSYTQHLLVLLFGTFRVIASNADHAGTGMTSEALGVSVAPSFFQSCVSDGKTAKMEDVLKFKVATKIMKHIIDKFATHDLFGRENYEYYARVTGRILKVQEEWICSFQYPPPPRGKLAQQKYALQHSLEAEKTWLQCQCERWGLLAQEESRSTPALLTSSSSALGNSALSLGMTPENSFIESCARLSVSLEGPGLFAMTSSPLPKQKESEIHKRKSDMHICSDDNDCAAYDNAVDDDSENDADDDDDEVSDEDKNEYCGGENANNATDDTLEQEFEFGMSRKSHGEYISKSRMKMHVHRSCNDNNKDCSDPGGAIAGSGVCDVFYNSRGHNDEGDDGAAVKRHFRQRKPKASKPHNFSLLVLGSSSTSAVNKCVAPSVANAQQRAKMRTTSKSLDGNTKIIREQLEGLQQTSSKIAMTTATLTLTSSGNSTVLGGTGGDGTENTTKVRTCTRCNRNIRHSPSCSSTSAGQGTAVNPEPRHICNHTGINMNELRVVNRYAESTKSLSYLPQVRDEFLLTSRISV